MPVSLYEQLTAQRAQRYAQNEADDSYLQNAPNAGAGAAAGLFKGFTDRLQTRQLESQLKFEDNKNKAIEMVKSIPMNEHNFPIILRLMTDINQAQPGKKHGFLDYFSKEPDPNELAIQNIWKKVKDATPNNSNVGGEDELGLVSVPPDPNKFQFQEEGQFQQVNDVFEDEKGKFLLGVNKKKGTTKRIELGNVTTSRERADKMKMEQYRAKRDEDMNKPVIKQMILDTGLEYDDLRGLTPDAWAQHFTTATQKLAAVEKQKGDVRDSIITRNNNINQTREVDPVTGLTPSQTEVSNQKKMDDARQQFNLATKAERDLTTAKGDFEAAIPKVAGQVLKDPNTGELIMTRAQRVQYETAKAKIQAAQTELNNYGAQIEAQFSNVYKVIRDEKGNVVKIEPRPGANITAPKKGKGAAAPSRGGLINRQPAPRYNTNEKWDKIMGNGQPAPTVDGSGYTPPPPIK